MDDRLRMLLLEAALRSGAEGGAHDMYGVVRLARPATTEMDALLQMMGGSVLLGSELGVTPFRPEGGRVVVWPAGGGKVGPMDTDDLVLVPNDGVAYSMPDFPNALRVGDRVQLWEARDDVPGVLKGVAVGTIRQVRTPY